MCACELDKGHEGDHRCDCGIKWANEAEPATEPEAVGVKVGDRVRVIANRSTHGYTIGQTVIVTDITPNVFNAEIYTRSLDSSENWYLGKNEYEVIPETETQIEPKREGLTVAELIAELEQMDSGQVVRVSNPYGDNFCIKEIGAHSEYVWLRGLTNGLYSQMPHPHAL